MLILFKSVSSIGRLFHFINCKCNYLWTFILPTSDFFAVVWTALPKNPISANFTSNLGIYVWMFWCETRVIILHQQTPCAINTNVNNGWKFWLWTSVKTFLLCLHTQTNFSTEITVNAPQKAIAVVLISFRRLVLILWQYWNHSTSTEITSDFSRNHYWFQ